MKNILNFFLLAFLILMFSSCFKKTYYHSCDPIEFSGEGGIKTFDDLLPCDGYCIYDGNGNKSDSRYFYLGHHIRVDVDTLDWLKVEEYEDWSTGKGYHTLTVTAAKNDTGKPRTLYIRGQKYTSQIDIYTIPVIQSE